MALSRVSQIALDALPPDASPEERDSATVDAHTGNLTKEEDVRELFEKYGKGGIWGVIHIAVRRKMQLSVPALNTSL